MADPRSTLTIVPIGQRNYQIDTPNSPGRPRDALAYARDLTTWANSYKYGFLFVTEIEFHPNYAQIADRTRLSLLTQSATRPKLKFEHIEYNEYGIRKRALTKTTFDPISLSILDDNDNSVMQFYINTLRMMSPITNFDNADVDNRQYDFRNLGGGSILSTKSAQNGTGVVNMETSIGPYQPNAYAQSSGYPGETIRTSLNARSGESATSIFKSVKIHHVFLSGEGVNTFTFMNPKLLTMDFDDLDMKSDEPSMLKMSFGYDYFVPSTGAMTVEIAKLVGKAEFHLRQDLVNGESSGGSNDAINQGSANTTVGTMTAAQVATIDAQVAAARAQATSLATNANATAQQVASYSNLADGLMHSV